MSYATGTTHYNLPQTVGTDKRDWFDTNQAFADIDTALFGAVQTAEQAASDLTTLAGRVTNTETDIATLQETVGTHGTQLSSLQSTVTQNTSDIADVRNDCEDMITAYNEGSATTSTRAYAVGDYFIYNDVLYRATTAIAIGDTIVPNTNCVATNITTEIGNISSLSNNLVVSGDSYSQLFNRIGNYLKSADAELKDVVVLRATGSGSYERYILTSFTDSGYNLLSYRANYIYTIGASFDGIATWHGTSTSIGDATTINILDSTSIVPSGESWYVRIS